MKIKLSIIFLISLGFISCQKVLDIAPDGRKSLDEIFADDVTTGAYLNTCYKNFPKWGTNEFLQTNRRIGCSDDSWDHYPSPIQGYSNNYYRGSATAQNPIMESDPQAGYDNFIGFWNKHWENIRSCNVFLSRIATATVNLESDRKRWTAEAKALRAFYNFELIKRYGGLPIVTSPLGLDYDYTKLNRESFKVSVDNILKDCDDALATPEFPWRITAAADAFRFNKAIASAVKSQAILFAASDLWNGGQNYWAQAETITKKSLDDCLANGYELYSILRTPSTFKSAYQEYYTSYIDWSSTPVDKETILASSQRDGTNCWINIQGMPIKGAARTGCNPSQELVDAYDMQTTGKPVLNLEKPYLDEKHLQPNYVPNSGYDPANPYVGRDPRFYASIYYNGDMTKNSAGVLTEVQTYYGGNCGILQPNVQRTITGYYTKKYDHPLSLMSAKIFSTYKVITLAELYLNYAEAANENGHLANAVAAVNVIRNRAGMPNINPASKDEARLLIRHERRVEFAYGENRYFDVRRYQKPGGDLSATDKYITGLWIVKTGTKYSYTRFVINDDFATGTWTNTGTPRLCYTNKYLIWPILLSESLRLQTATGKKWQNPGW